MRRIALLLFILMVGCEAPTAPEISNPFDPDFTGGRIPGPPTGLSMEPVSPTSVRIIWKDNSSFEDGYIVERALVGGAFQEIGRVGPDVTAFEDTDLASTRRRLYRVNAFSGNVRTPAPDTLEIRYPSASRFVTSEVGSIDAVAFHPTGDAFASGGLTLVRLWSAPDVALQGAFEGSPYVVNSLDYSAAGDLLLVGGYNQFRLFTGGGGPVRRVEVYPFGTNFVSAALSPDGSLVASAGRDLRLYRASDGALVKQLTEDDGGWSYYRSADFSPDGRLLAAGGGFVPRVDLWDVATQRLFNTAQIPTEIWDVKYSPDGELIAVGCADGKVYLLDGHTGALADIITPPPVVRPDEAGSIVGLAFDRPGEHLLIGGGRRLLVYRIATDQVVREIAVEETPNAFFTGLRDAALDPDMRYVAGGSNGSTVEFWDLRAQWVQVPR